MYENGPVLTRDSARLFFVRHFAGPVSQDGVRACGTR